MDNSDVLLIVLYSIFGIVILCILIHEAIKIHNREKIMMTWIKMIVTKENIKGINPELQKEIYFRFKRELPSTAKHYADYEFEKFLFKVIEDNTKRKVKDKTYYWYKGGQP